MLPARPRAAFDLMVELTLGRVRGLADGLSYRSRAVAHAAASPGLEIPMSYPYYGMVVGGVYLLLVAVRRIAGEPLAREHEAHAVMIWFLLALLLGTMLIGVPILLCIALVSFIGIAAVPGPVLPLFAQKMFAQLDSFTLLALPYFILAGVADVGGRHEPAAGRFRARAGRPPARRPRARGDRRQHGVRGHLRLVARRTRRRSSAIVIPTMKQSGYKPGFAAALIATAGTIGAIIPPSMTMVVYGAIAQVSIGGLFLGGIIPGLLVGLFLMATVKLYTYHPNYPELRVVHGHFDPGAIVRSLRDGLAGADGAGHHRRRHPVGRLHRDRSRRGRLPLRAAVGTFFYRKIRLRDLATIFVEAAITTTMVSGDHRRFGRVGLAARLPAVQRHGGHVRHLGVAEPGDRAAHFRGA